MERDRHMADNEPSPDKIPGESSSGQPDRSADPLGPLSEREIILLNALHKANEEKKQKEKGGLNEEIFSMSPQMKAALAEIEGVDPDKFTDEMAKDAKKRADVEFRKLKESERAERYGLSAIPKPGFKYEWIHSQQLGDMPVEWPDTQEGATEHVKEVLSKIEIAQKSITQQMQIDYQNAKAVLEMLEFRTEQEGMTEKEVGDQRKWAEKMRKEIEARIELHQACLKYENGSSVKDAAEVIVGFYGGWLNTIFELEQQTADGRIINPFVEAIQYYEDHGHKFARHNSETGRPEFGAEVIEYLINKFGGEAKNYKWAQNMAERLFRATGRAIMYDYLVINKGTDKEQMVRWDYDGPESPEWAGGRDGCDYPLSKIYRFRENLRSNSEFSLMRSQIELLNGVDLYAGDFWTRTVDGRSFPEEFRLSGADKRNLVKIPGEEITPIVTFHITQEHSKKLLEKKQKDYEESYEEDVKKGKLTQEESREKAKIKAEEYIKNNCYIIPDQGKYVVVDEDSDRDFADNTGERVRHINFKIMQRKTIKEEGKKDQIVGIDFNEMGTTPFSLWVSRMLLGPEEGKGPLTGNAEAFLRNPNFESLAKLRDAFDYSKGNAWKVKQNLVINYIKYAREKIEATGRQRLSEDEILAGVNKLTGFTDPNAPQFIQLPERIKILADYFNLKVDKESIETQAKEYVRRNYPRLNLTDAELEKEENKSLKEEFDHLVDAMVNKNIDKKLNAKIEKRIALKFGASFAGWFLWGTIKEAIKQAFK